MTIDDDVAALVDDLGGAPRGYTPKITPLTGGVSSDVVRVDLPGGPICVKRAMPALRVAADWRAPIERSHYEVEWLRIINALGGVRAPKVLCEIEARHAFAMSFFDPETHKVWKSELAAGRADPSFAGAVGKSLAAIHAGTAYAPEIAERFPTDEFFEALRLSPFLRRCAEVHADLAPKLVALAERTAGTKIALVHGDVSPKNILVGPEGPVFLDAECAWYGDPAFDLAFCSAHLLLKTVWKPQFQASALEAFAALQTAYRAGVSWEPATAVDARASELTAAVLLARVDGKSPADYLQSEEDRGFVRAGARALVQRGATGMDSVAAFWREGLQAR